MNQIKALIFDLDGVLVSTDEQHYLGWQALADRLGIPFSREVNNRFRGVSRMACMDILEEIGGKCYTDQEKIAYATWKNNFYRNLLGEMTPADLTADVKATLEELRERGYKLVKLPLVQARVSCMSLMLVTLVLQGDARINYALGRLIGTLVGAVVALLVSMLWVKLFLKEKGSVMEASRTGG